MPPEAGRLRIAVLGSTGSIGTQTLDVIREHPDRFELLAIAAGTNVELVRAQVAEFSPRVVSLDGKAEFASPSGIDVLHGEEGLLACATHKDVDVVVVATSGITALAAVLGAARLGKVIALANKESLVCAAEILLPIARASRAEIRPVDSEHSAIWQSMGALRRSDVACLTLTASGGPFRTLPLERLPQATPDDALRHPTWNMGAKISIDSATLVNKGLEIIEANRLFEVPYDRIQVVIHPESIVHSLVEFVDGSTIAQLSRPDMRVPILYALTAPEHAPHVTTSLDLARLGSLTFESPDLNRFPALEICRAAGEAGGSTSAVLCAADEVAVEAFLAGEIRFTKIPHVLEQAIQRHVPAPLRSIEDVTAALREATAVAREIVRSL